MRRRQRVRTVVLVHGFVGFARIGVGTRGISYFRGVRRLVESTGMRCLVPHLPSGRPVRTRAEALARALDLDGGEPFALLAHSAGGLDGRYVISRLDPQRRVRVLVTLGTPHNGTSAAERALSGRSLGSGAVRLLARGALEDLTRPAADRFNTDVPDREDVLYYSYAGTRPPPAQSPLLRPFGRRILDAEGPNDGLVTAESAKWGDFRGIVAADHAELVGWDLTAAGLFGRTKSNASAGRTPFDHRQLYGEVLDLVGRADHGA